MGESSNTSSRTMTLAPTLIVGLHVSLLNLAVLVLVMLSLTGFVSAKPTTEEECLSTNVLCYECDSRYDSNCADPFDSSSTSITDMQETRLLRTPTENGNTTSNLSESKQTLSSPIPSETNSTMIPPRLLKKYPPLLNCHGCCVKMTSRTPEKEVYVKRTCTTNLQINYFMVGLVCMKESGDRGKMCFCETDYCNSQPSSIKSVYGADALATTLCALVIMILSVGRPVAVL